MTVYSYLERGIRNLLAVVLEQFEGTLPVSLSDSLSGRSLPLTVKVCVCVP
jgi:hypothetical protein